MNEHMDGCRMSTEEELDAIAELQKTLPRAVGMPATGAFAVAGYRHIDEFTKVHEKDLLKLHGVGPKAIKVLRETLAAQGKSFAQ